jgi:hypothetical protein
MTRSYRWGPLAGVGFVILIVVAFGVGGSSPDTSGPSTKIATYLVKSSAFNRNVAALFIALAAVILLVLFYAALRIRLSTADLRFGSHGTLALAAGIVSAVFLFMAVSMFVAPLLAAHDARPNPIDPNLYRLMQDGGYVFWVAAGAFGGVAAFATAAAVLGGSFLPRWFGWVSIVLGVISLAAFFFVPMFGYWLWVLIGAIVLTVRPGPAPGATTPVATTAVPPTAAAP